MFLIGKIYAKEKENATKFFKNSYILVEAVQSKTQVVLVLLNHALNMIMC